MLQSARGKKVVSWLPIDRILLETDGPFAKVDGEALFPSSVDMVADYLSKSLEIEKQNILEQLTVNLRLLVSK